MITTCLAIIENGEKTKRIIIENVTQALALTFSIFKHISLILVNNAS